MPLTSSAWSRWYAGTMTKYPYFWPAALPTTRSSGLRSPTSTMATLAEAGLDQGQAVRLPIGDTSRFTEGTVIFVGGPNVVFGPHSDWGDRRPTDVGFSAQPVISGGSYSNYQVNPRETLNLAVDYSEPMVPLTGAGSTPWRRDDRPPPYQDLRHIQRRTSRRLFVQSRQKDRRGWQPGTGWRRADCSG